MSIHNYEYLKQLVPGKQIHVFLCFNLMPNVYLDKIVEQEKLDKKFIVIEFYKINIINNIDPLRIFKFIYGDSRFLYIFELVQAKSLIDEIYSYYSEVYFYFSHPMHILSNYLYFNERVDAKICMLPDGIANYYNVTTNKYRKSLFVKKIVSMLVGIRYRFYQGHITCYKTGRYIKAYSLSADGFLFSGDPVTIDMKAGRDVYGKKDKEKILILGQPSNSCQLYIDSLSKIILSFPDRSKFIYKPHPAEHMPPLLISWFQLHCIDVLHTENSAECLVGEFHVFASSLSSGLFSIKLINGSNVVCRSFVEPRVIDELFSLSVQDWDRIKQKFLSVGVEVDELQ